MLKQRILTAVVLLALLLPALFAGRYEFFAAVTLVAVVLASWEWARLLRLAEPLQWTFAAVVSFACGALWFAGFSAKLTHPLVWASCGAWALMLSLTLPAAHLPAFLLSGVGRALHLLFAALALASAWLSLVLAKQQGAWFVLSLLLLVWIADTAAYFAGRAFGRHKLAPHISPGKTWEGAVAGVVAAAVYAGACAYGNGSYFTALSQGHPLKAFVFGGILAAVSITGDLFESALKRQAGAKDSSRLLPGHGGFLDRLDALLPTLPLAWLLLL